MSDVLEAARRMIGPIEPDGSYAVDGFFRDAAVVARALLSSPQVEEWIDFDTKEAIIAARREALEEAAKVAERGCLTHPDGGSPTEPERELCEAIARDIRALTAKETER